jgi:hypothetical protein
LEKLAHVVPAKFLYLYEFEAHWHFGIYARTKLRSGRLRAGEHVLCFGKPLDELAQRSHSANIGNYILE